MGEREGATVRTRRELPSRKLNLGCGADIRPGWVNLDRADLPGVDVVHDLDALPLPFADGTFEKILCRSVLEHVDYPPLLGELHRILMPGGRLKIQVPHFTSSANFIDPTHRKMFSVRTFEFFVAGSPYAHRGYYFPFQFSEIRRARIVFERRGRARPKGIIERLVNRNRTTQARYEDTFLSRLFPAHNIIVVLVK